jgi:hypothetical protein
VERLGDVDLPVAAEGLPGVVLQRPGQGVRAGVENDDCRVVLVEQPPRHRGIGGVRPNSDEPFPQVLELLQGCPVMGDPDDPRPRIQQRCADGPAETAARARHECGCAGQLARHRTAGCPVRSPSAPVRAGRRTAMAALSSRTQGMSVNSLLW